MLSTAEHRACIGSFHIRLRFCYYGKKIWYNKEILKYLFSSSCVCKYCTSFGFIIPFCELAFCKVEINCETNCRW